MLYCSLKKIALRGYINYNKVFDCTYTHTHIHLWSYKIVKLNFICFDVIWPGILNRMFWTWRLYKIIPMPVVQVNLINSLLQFNIKYYIYWYNTAYIKILGINMPTNVCIQCIIMYRRYLIQYIIIMSTYYI